MMQLFREQVMKEKASSEILKHFCFSAFLLHNEHNKNCNKNNEFWGQIS